MEKLQTFEAQELQLLVCGEQSPSWTREDILNYTEPKYGYTRTRSVSTCSSGDVKRVLTLIYVIWVFFLSL